MSSIYALFVITAFPMADFNHAKCNLDFVVLSSCMKPAPRSPRKSLKSTWKSICNTLYFSNVTYLQLKPTAPGESLFIPIAVAWLALYNWNFMLTSNEQLKAAKVTAVTLYQLNRVIFVFIRLDSTLRLFALLQPNNLSCIA